MILSAQTITGLSYMPRDEARFGKPMIFPFMRKTVFQGLSFGLSPAGYDIRIKQDVCLFPGDFVLASAIEKFAMPRDVLGIVHDKSTLARRGLSVFNTVIEPGWEGFLTLELKNQGKEVILLYAGSGVAQVVFHRLDMETTIPYDGKYQDQADEPVPAIMEETCHTSNGDGMTTPSSQFSLSLDLAEHSSASQTGEKIPLKGELVFFNPRR